MNDTVPREDISQPLTPADDSVATDPGGATATLAERDALLRDRQLHKKLRYVLTSKGVDEADLDDVMQVVLLEAHSAPGLPGGGGPGRDRFVLAIGRNRAIDHARRYDRDVDVDDEQDLQALPAPARDAVADRDLVEKFLDDAGGDLHTLRCLARVWLGEPLVDIAREEDIAYDTLRKRVDALKDHLRQRAAVWLRTGRAGAALAAMLAVVFGGWRATRPVPTLGPDGPDPLAGLDRDLTAPVGEGDPEVSARALRGQAYRACLDRRWADALEGLDAAAAIDPIGERDPLVVAARRDATLGYSGPLKPVAAPRPTVAPPYAPWATR